MKDAKEFCTCTDYKCPYHPVNHDQGCDLFIQKKASSPDRMMENLDVFCFDMTDDEISYLSCIPETGWSGEHPNMTDF